MRNLLCWLLGHKWEDRIYTFRSCLTKPERYRYKKCERCHEETEWVEMK